MPLTDASIKKDVMLPLGSSKDKEELNKENELARVNKMDTVEKRKYDRD